MFVLQKEKTAEHGNGEDDGAENAVLQVSAENGSHKSRNGRTGGAPEVTRKGKQCKHGRAAEFHTLRCKREGAGPENTDGKSADHASDQCNDGIGRKTDNQIADNAKDRAEHGSALHRNLFAEFCIENAGNAHRNGESASTEKISDGFVYRKCALCKRGYPLRNGKFGSSRANHHEKHEPENLLRKQLFIVGLVVFFFADRKEGNEGEEKDVEKGNEREQAGEESPVRNADKHEERCAEQNGGNDTPAIEGMQKTHDARFIL